MGKSCFSLYAQLYGMNRSMVNISRVKEFIRERGQTCGDPDYDPVSCLLLISAFAMLLLCLFGTYGNLVSVWIFTRPSMRSPINILLTGLSLIDLGLVVLVVPVLVLPTIFFNPYMARFPAITQLYTKKYKWTNVRILYPLMTMAQTASNWIFILISTERYIAVCRPFHSSRYATKQKATISVVVVLVASCLYNLVRFWEYSGSYQGVKPMVRGDAFYVYFYYTGMYLVFHFLLPFGSLLALNICIFRALHQDRLLSGNDTLRRHHRNRSRRRNSTTLMIGIVTGIFAICNIPPFVLNFWEAYEGTGIFRQPNTKLIATSIFCVGNFLVTFNSASTFLVYLGFCQRYRSLFQPFPWKRRRVPEMRGRDATFKTCQTLSGTRLSARTRSIRASYNSAFSCTTFSPAALSETIEQHNNGNLDSPGFEISTPDAIEQQ